MFVAYLLGNISGGLILGKLFFNKDIETMEVKMQEPQMHLEFFLEQKPEFLTFVIDFFKAI